MGTIHNNSKNNVNHSSLLSSNLGNKLKIDNVSSCEKNRSSIFHREKFE